MPPPANPRIHSRAGLGAALCRSENSGRTAAIRTSRRRFTIVPSAAQMTGPRLQIHQKTDYRITGSLYVAVSSAVEFCEGVAITRS